MQSASIYHLARGQAWRDARSTGVYEGSTDDRRDGFLHFSTGVQIRESAARHRAGEEDLYLLRVYAADCGDALRWEASRHGDLFPHLYGSLQVSLVQQAEPLPIDEAGAHVFPELVRDRRLFFYGLFMDRTLLIQKGLHPVTLGPAVLHGYRIHIGERATLARSATSRAHGVVMSLREDEANTLYADPSVCAYAPVPVSVELATGTALSAECYILPPEELHGTNAAYAKDLTRLVKSLQFDAGYVDEVASFSGAT
ncbi:MAG: DUF952 domain-containing protein [Planctomycetes bacterium]|nr:DUF952 domain-containing protein [Planctomycetota bacterium]